jgi:outer membrane protein assembly factor BamB
MFHGDAQHSGQSPAVGPGSATLLWRYPAEGGIGPSRSAPVIGPDGTMYIARSSGSFNCGTDPYGRPSGCGTVVDAVSPTGSLVWEWSDATETVLRSTPAVAPDGTVYLTSDDGPGDLVSIAPGGKTTNWKLSGHNLQGTPTVGPDGTVYVEDAGSTIYAVDPANGSVLWHYSGSGGSVGVRGTPALSPDGSAIYFGSGGGDVYSLDAAGHLNWQVPISGPSGGGVENAPAVGPDGTIYVATLGTYGNTPGDIDAITPAGTMKWHYTTDGTFETTPAVTSAGLVVANNDVGTVVAVHASDGTFAWSFAAPGSYGSNGFYDSSPAVGADGTVYTQNGAGTLFAIRDGSSVWSAPGASDASPALDSETGTLYVAGGGGVSAYLGSKAPTGGGGSATPPPDTGGQGTGPGGGQPGPPGGDNPGGTNSPPSADDNGAGAPAPTCGDHTENVGPFTIEAACFERQGATLVASGRIRVNGIDVAIDGSGSFRLDILHRKLSASAPVTISLGSIQVYKGSFDWELTGPSISIPKLPSLKIKGLPVTGGLSAEAENGGRTSITADARVGAADGPAVTGELKLSLSNDLGLQLDHAKLALSQVGIKALLLKDASLSYDRTAEGEDQWTGELTLVLPGELPTVHGKVVLLHGQLSEVALNATDINKWIGGFVYLQKLGLDVKLIPTLDVTGLLGLSAGPSIPGVSAAAFTLDSSLEATFGDPVVIDLKGNLKAAGEVDLAQAEAKWTVPDRFQMNGHAGFAKAGVGIDLNVSGGVDPRGFWLYGQGSVTVPHVGSANGLGYVSEKGITACASVTESNLGLFDTTVGGGFGYHWGGGLDLWFDDCGALDFKSAAQSAGVHGAGVDQPVDLRVPAGQNQTIFGARGVSEYPSFTLRSPSGAVIDPATGDRGGVDNNAYLWVTDPGRHGTYVIVAHPRPGAWRLTPKPDSPAIATVGSALSAPPPHVASRVRYRAGRYSVSWNAHVAPADELRFVENAGDTERVLLDVHKTKGTARIRPADTGRGEQRRITVQVLRRGLVQSILKGPRFRVLPPPKPLPARRIKIVRHGTKATVSWQRVPRAASYNVWLTTSDGRRLYFRQSARARSVQLDRVALPLRVHASITTVARDGLQSRVARATFKLTAHRKRRP